MHLNFFYNVEWRNFFSGKVQTLHALLDLTFNFPFHLENLCLQQNLFHQQRVDVLPSLIGPFLF